MTSTTAIIRKNEGVIQFVKFGLVGVSNTGVDWIVYFILTKTFLHNGTYAKAVSFLVAMLNSYLWNTIWTFKKEYKNAVGNGETKAKSGGIFIKFTTVSLIGWGINVLTYNYTINTLSQREIIALIAASGAATLLNFFMNKFWTYKK